jgi:hypothetical protein
LQASDAVFGSDKPEKEEVMEARRNPRNDEKFNENE